MLRNRFGYTTLAVSILFIALLLQNLSAGAQQQPQQTCRTFPETGKTVCGRFLAYWNSHGGVVQQGFPISPEIPEVSQLDNKLYTVQYFERAVFEYHSENAAPNDVLLSQLGTFRYKQLYEGGGAPAKVRSRTFQLGDKAEIRPGVWVTFFVAEVSGSYITWRGVLHNDSDSVFNLRMDKESTTVSDSTGRVYTMQSLDLSKGGDIAPGDYRNIVVSAYLYSKPPAPEAKYLALNIYNLSGTGPYIFYRNF
jgi:hypothetical protein